MSARFRADTPLPTGGPLQRRKIQFFFKKKSQEKRRVENWFQMHQAAQPTPYTAAPRSTIPGAGSRSLTAPSRAQQRVRLSRNHAIGATTSTSSASRPSSSSATLADDCAAAGLLAVTLAYALPPLAARLAATALKKEEEEEEEVAEATLASAEEEPPLTEKSTDTLVVDACARRRPAVEKSTRPVPVSVTLEMTTLHVGQPASACTAAASALLSSSTAAGVSFPVVLSRATVGRPEKTTCASTGGTVSRAQPSAATELQPDPSQREASERIESKRGLNTALPCRAARSVDWRAVAS